MTLLFSMVSDISTVQNYFKYHVLNIYYERTDNISVYCRVFIFHIHKFLLYSGWNIAIKEITRYK